MPIGPGEFQPSAAWASTKSWDSDNTPRAGLRDKYGRKITAPPPAEPPKATTPKASTPKASSAPARPFAAPKGAAAADKAAPALKGAQEISSTGAVRGIEHVRVAGHHNLMKKVLTVGDGARGCPSPGARVTIHAEGYLPMKADGSRSMAATEGYKFYSTKERIVHPGASLTELESSAAVAPGPQTFNLGGGAVLPCWDLTAPTMLVGEKCELIVAAEHAYGEEGAEHLGVPPKVPVVFVLELLAWKRAMPARETMPDDERFKLATELKFRGTERFKAGAWDEARELYDDAAHYLSDAFLGDEMAKTATSIEHPEALNSLRGMEKEARSKRSDVPEKPPDRFGEQHDEAKAMLLACLLNGAQCALKTEAWREAESRSSTALALEPKNLKGLFRRGTARTRIGDYSDARGDLRRACELDPKSREIRDMFDECKIAESAEKEAQRQFYAQSGDKVVNDGAYGEPTEEEKDPLFVC